MQIIDKQQNDIKITLIAVKLGNDFNISIFGGNKPHIGAAALAVPRRSLAEPEKISASVSNITVTGHKEDELARRAAAMLAARFNCVVCVACGIHIDAAEKAQISLIEQLTLEAINEVEK